ncbi:MAG TPA: metallophosphoesterase family protein [Chloroflexi bacterium]|nr:metallophosphoesterase family protein [Chloroflexota bacterium]
MRVLVVSDIHSNLVALDAVLQDAGPFDVIWSLGDVVGYGPQPNECIERLQEYPHVAIAGNHDWGVLGKLDLEQFNNDARLANLWNRDVLRPASREYLEALPITHTEGGVTLAHGSPRHPIWEYLLYASLAKVSFKHFDTSLCLVGHSHVPVVFRDLPDRDTCEVLPPADEAPAQLEEGQRYIINPGSVGQPRDGDPRAAYLMLDLESGVYEHRRVTYDISATQERMRQADLPRRLITRLNMGW